MTSRIENTYGTLFKYMLLFMNPLKKAVIKTPCSTHKFINIQAIEILKNDNFSDAYTLFSDYIEQLNEGVVWADQDFKSSGHFYNPVKMKGLYGSKDALSTAREYYREALENWVLDNEERAMFYLGAALHIVQDMTVPQHANIRLLDNHRKYENFIKRVYLNTPQFFVDHGGYYVESIEEAVHCNARVAIIVHSRLKHIEDDSRRFYAITKFTLPLAQKTTAGCLMRFYRDISAKEKH